MSAAAQRVGQLGVVQMAGPYVEHDLEIVERVPRTEPGGDVLVVVEDKHAKGHTGILAFGKPFRHAETTSASGTR